jgi:DNA repair exonuclease SbcCD ATPase subunit
LHREYSLVYQSYQTGVQELQSFDQSLPVPVTKPDDSTILAIKNMLIDKKPLYQMAKSKICPTCNREFSFTTPPDDVIKVYEDTAAALVPLETAYNADLRKFNDYERRLAIYTNQKETLERKVANLSTKLQTFTDDVKDFDIVAYDQSVNSVRELTAKLNEYHTKLNQIQKDIQNHQHMHDTLMSQCVITDAQRHVYKTELALLTELNNNCTTLDLQLAGLSATIKTNQENLLRLQDNQQRYQKIKGVRTQLEKAREILHRDALPRVVMSRILGSLNACLEFYLTKFNSGIVAKITDDFDILASVNGGPLTHARRLSGGQKVAVVVSFRFALSEVFARSIPLLVLDEPTAWLDTKRKESMVDVLKLAKAFVEKGVYVFIMTHDPVLEPAMSRIIEV